MLTDSPDVFPYRPGTQSLRTPALQYDPGGHTVMLKYSEEMAVVGTAKKPSGVEVRFAEPVGQ